MDKIKILILAANPWETNRLSLDEEYQRIQKIWRKSNLKESFDLLYWPAMRGEELQQEVLEFKPHLIHFSGHGENNSLVFSDLTGDKSYEVTKQALAQLFKSCAPDLKAVFLNACHSAKQAEAMVEQVDYVVGMNADINDLAAIHFSQGFYTAIFTQEILDIEKAFAAGQTQMAITQTPETEQKKPVLQKRRQTFVPSHTYDIAISFAEADKEWMQNFTAYLHKQLKQKLATADGFQIYSSSEFEPLHASALLLCVASPDYLTAQQNQFESLKNLVTQKPVFLLETDSYKLPEGLKGLSRHKFWIDDEKDGIVPLQGEAYIDKANQVCDLIAKKLQELKTQHQHQQRIAQKRQQQQENRPKTTQSLYAFVFLHTTTKDLVLAKRIEDFLAQYGIWCAVSIEALAPNTPADEIRADRKSNMLNCDGFFVIYENGSLAWARNPLIDYREIKSLREEKGKIPLKIIAVHKKRENTELGIKMDNLKIYDCPPEKIEDYLHDFISALA